MGSVGTQDHGGLREPGELQKPRAARSIKGTKKFMGDHKNQEKYQIKGNRVNQGNHKIKWDQ